MKLKKGTKIQRTDQFTNDKDLRLQYIRETGSCGNVTEKAKFLKEFKGGYTGWLEQQLLKELNK